MVLYLFNKSEFYENGNHNCQKLLQDQEINLYLKKIQSNR